MPFVLAILGVLSVAVGLWLIFPPLAFLAVGSALVWVALRLEALSAREVRQ